MNQKAPAAPANVPTIIQIISMSEILCVRTQSALPIHSKEYNFLIDLMKI